jgi:hypothetical protein
MLLFWPVYHAFSDYFNGLPILKQVIPEQKTLDFFAEIWYIAEQLTSSTG